VRRFLLSALAIVLVVGIAITVALLVTPTQTVSAAGQTVRVGVAAPSLSLSGPGELKLFGQGLPTTIEFAGPVRPRLELAQITLSPQLAGLIQPDGDSSAWEGLQQALVDGWVRYLAWQVAIVALIAMVLLGAVAGWRRLSKRSTLAFLAVGLVVAEAVNLGAAMSTAYTAPARLRQIDSLQALVGIAPVPALPAPDPQLPPQRGRLVVIGDSTAAGLGNPPLPQGDVFDIACERSVDSFPNALDIATDRRVFNLACSGATIRTGLLEPQRIGSLAVPAQLPRAVASGPSAIIISVGANDVNWSGILRICAAMQDCRNAAVVAYFEQQLASFTREYLALLTQLRSMPNPPAVVVNLYYNPLVGNIECLASLGVTDEKRRVLVERLDALNTVLADGAATASFTVAQPNFTGHGLCSDQPYVQGLDAKAPFHPTAAGALAIALADQQALRTAGA
jgi:lysophospholipase L1-like esterase